MMKVSATEGGTGSVATSAVPILATTRSTSGNAAMRASSAVCIWMAWLRLVPGMRSACMAMSPSSRLGTNSEPIRDAPKPASNTSATAMPIIRPRVFNAKSSAG